MKNKMSHHGATLQTYNQELVKCLEDLKVKKKEILRVVKEEEYEKCALEKDIKSLQEKLNNVNNNLEKHKALCDSYEKTIQDTESGFKKVNQLSASLDFYDIRFTSRF
jgi:Sjoegren syndrome nuclear autoantigen 1